MSVNQSVEDLSSNGKLEKQNNESIEKNSIENEHIKSLLQSIVIELNEIKQYIKQIAE